VSSRLVTREVPEGSRKSLFQLQERR